MGKITISPKGGVNDSKHKRIKPFHNELTNRKENVRETQAIQRNKREQQCLKESSSEKEHKVNALASGADEGRDKLRKATVSCK